MKFLLFLFLCLVARPGLSSDWPPKEITGCKSWECSHLTSGQSLTTEQWRMIHTHPSQQVCRDLTPRHFDCQRRTGCIQAQTGDPPFYIYGTNSNNKLKVTVNVTGEEPLRGLIVQAYGQNPDSEFPLGHFEAMEPPGVAEFLEFCLGGEANNTLLMYSEFGVHQLDLIWVPPTNVTYGDIVFRLAAVFTYDKFWVRELRV